VSPHCFYNFFVPASSVTSTYPLVECSVYDSNGDCVLSVLELYSTNYTPPFSYSYQCADDIVSKYAPSLVYQCVLLTFAYPLSVLAAIHVFKHYPSDSLLFRTVHAIYPSVVLKTTAGGGSGGAISSRQAVVKVQDAAVGGSITGRALSGVTSTADDDHDHEGGKKGSLSSSTREETTAVFDASLEIVYFLSLSGSMLTFGVAFPPLAVAFLLAIISLWCISRHMCDRFLLEALSARRLVEVDALTHDCQGAINRSMILNSFWVIICCSACFYSLFLFDMLGYKHAYWIIIAAALWPLSLYSVEAACRRGRRYYAKRKGTQQNITGIEGIAVELSTAQSPLPMPS